MKCRYSHAIGKTAATLVSDQLPAREAAPFPDEKRTASGVPLSQCLDQIDD